MLSQTLTEFDDGNAEESGDIHSEKSVAEAVAEIEAEHEYARDSRRPEHPGGGMTGIFGRMGSGKTLLAVTWLSLLYRTGTRIFYTPTAGLRFGTPTDLKDLYTIAVNHRHSVIFMDELQSYINKYGQTATSSVMFTESLAALRKNRVHVIYTAQHDSQASISMRYNTDRAWYPIQSGSVKRLPRRAGRRWNRKPKWDRVSGRHTFCKLLVSELSGNALSFTEAPDHLHIRLKMPTPMPRFRRFRPPYQDVFEASKLYNTLEQIDFGARWRVDSKAMKEHVGLVSPGRAEGKDADLMKRLARFQRDIRGELN